MTMMTRDPRRVGRKQLRELSPGARHVEPSAILALVPTRQRLEIAAILLADEVRRLRDPSIAPPAGANDERLVTLSHVLRDCHTLRQSYGAGNIDGIRLRYQLSRRRKDVLALLLFGLQEKEIGIRLGLSRHTVHEHVKRLYRDMLVSTRAELMAKFLHEEFGELPGTRPALQEEEPTN